MRIGEHRRTPDILANLALGLRRFIDFAADIGVPIEGEELFDRRWRALGVAAARQVDHVQAVEPAQRYIELLKGAITTGAAHVADRNGEEPGADDDPRRWGWQLHSGSHNEPVWQRRGDLVGWIDGDDLYIDPVAAYKVVQGMCGSSNGLGVSERMMRKRLRQAGFMKTTDEKRGKTLVRRILQAQRRDVLHLRADLSGTDARENKDPDTSADTDGPVMGAIEDCTDKGQAHKKPPSLPGKHVYGPKGPLGPVTDDGPECSVASPGFEHAEFIDHAGTGGERSISVDRPAAEEECK